MRYGITDLSHILGVITSAIRFFEKEGIIRVDKETNGRRNYNEQDVFRLLSYTKYRCMDIPIKEIIPQFTGKENDWTLIKKREEEAKKKALSKAAFYRELADSIEEHIQNVQNIDKLLGIYELAISPSMIFMQDPEHGWISTEPEMQKIICQWVSKMPTVQLAVIKTGNDISANFGFVVPEGAQATVDLPMQDFTRKLEVSLCVHTVIKADEDFVFKPQKIFTKACEYARKRGFQICHNPWGRILLVEEDLNEVLHTFVELWIPIQ